MELNAATTTRPWTWLQKTAFRFCFIYLTLYMAPWSWFDQIPGVGTLTKPFLLLTDWAVNAGNQYLFHLKTELVPLNGSGDTSYGWAQVCLYLVLAAAGCLLWGLLDRRQTRYPQLFYWLRTFSRYYLSFFLFLYGIIKLFAMQMVFPTTSLLATPLGDLLPMRLSWQFIGYSDAYQIFSGAMETLAGLLLLYRRTVTMGLLLTAGVFANVLMLNLCYDVPVKLFSLHLLLCCLFLLMVDGKRLYSFFVLNQATPGNDLYHFNYANKWMRIARIAAKTLFIAVAVGWTLYDSYTGAQFYKNQPEPRPFAGLYEVETLVVNRDTVPVLATDSLHWQNLIFEKNNGGSIGTTDTLFRQRYRRGYFSFETDTLLHTIALKRRQSDSLAVCTLHYEEMDHERVKFSTVFRGDSLHLECKKSKRHFQLAERQFHWLSESNR